MRASHSIVVSCNSDLHSCSCYLNNSFVKFSEMNFTPQEVEKLKEFRGRVKDLLIHDHQLHDSFLIRWLRARQLNVDKAEEMLKKSLEWRKTNNVDGICDREEIPKDFAAQIPFANCGIDPVSGCPLFLYLMGRVDIRSIMEEVGPDKFQHYGLLMMEKISKMMEDMSKESGKPVTQIIEIIDLEGFSYRQFASKLVRDYMSRSQKMMDENYPELLYCATFVNAPKIFTLLFNFMKHIVPKETMAKIDIHGADSEKWKKVLASKYPMNLIPKRWGGTLQGSDEFCSQSDIWMFGPLNSKYVTNANEDGFVKVKVKAGGKILLDFDVDESQSVENMSLTWKFKSENYDIAFGVLFDEEEMVPVKRLDSHVGVQEGKLECKSPGKYTLVFDNSYSYSRAKTIHHKVDLVLCDIVEEDQFSKCINEKSLNGL